MGNNVTINDSYVEKYNEERKNMENNIEKESEKPNKVLHVLKLIFNLVLMAILFGGVASAVFLVVTDTMKSNDSTGNKILTATSIPYIGETRPTTDDDDDDENKEVSAPVASAVDVSDVVESVGPATVIITAYTEAADSKADSDGADSNEAAGSKADSDGADSNEAADSKADSDESDNAVTAAEPTNTGNEQISYKHTRTGVIVGQNSSSIMILCAYRGFEDCDTYYVTLTNGDVVQAELKGFDKELDIAILTIEFAKMTQNGIDVVRIITMGDSTTAKAGQLVIACNERIYVGYVSSMSDKYTYHDNEYSLIKTDIKSDDDESYIIINSNAELLGIKTASDITESSILPISMLKAKILEIIETEPGMIGLAYLGIEGMDISADYSELFEMPEGVYVKSVEEGSPAEEAGILEGDVIYKINGVDVYATEDIDAVLGKVKPGEEISIILGRSEESIEAQLKATQDDDTPTDKSTDADEADKSISTDKSDKSTDADEADKSSDADNSDMSISAADSDETAGAAASDTVIATDESDKATADSDETTEDSRRELYGYVEMEIIVTIN